FTDCKVQGVTLKKVVVDLVSARGLQNTYVMMSHALSTAKVGVLRWFRPHHILTQLQQDLHDEL
ncbi:hypothetical protein PAXINDRAFT_32898, partial [Paxillus involutus ATCC 200175]